MRAAETASGGPARRAAQAASVVLVLALLAACRRAPDAAPAPANLLPLLGASRPVEVGEGTFAPDPNLKNFQDKTRSLETREAVDLRAGAPLRAAVSVPAGARVTLAATVLAGDAGGAPRLRVTGDGAPLLEVPLVQARQAWASGQVTLPRPVRHELRFEAEGGGPALRVALGAVRVQRQPPARRVLLWISVDTLRADHVGLYGYPRPTTPELDRQARQWLVFRDAVAAASWTLPSMATQMTGRDPSYHGAVSPTRARDRRQRTLFEALSAEGFQVLGVTANPFISPAYALAEGFDGLWTTGGNAREVTQITLDKALAEAGTGDLALFVHYFDPHAPYTPPKSYRAEFAIQPPSELNRQLGAYDGEIAFTDRWIGKLLAGLEQRGLTREAVVVWSADHGDEFLDHGGWRHAHTLYEELVHVPLALRVPGLAAGSIEGVFPEADLAPTVLEALRVPRPPSFLGRSRLAELRAGRLSPSRAVAETELGKDGTSLVSVREGAQKYVLRYRRDPARGLVVLQEQVFDLARDPREQSPLALQGAATERLRRAAREHLEGARGAVREEPATLSPEAEEQLRALGYIH